MSSVRERRYLFTSESVTEGHPDKVCDQISDGILDAIYEQDPDARVACEAALSPGLVVLMGEVTTRAKVDVAEVARRVIREIGYTHPDYGLDADNVAVLTALKQQSPDIARGVDRALEADGGDPLDAVGAGDQGLMFGYACKETPELMPAPLYYAHRILKLMAEARHAGETDQLGPDSKSQVTVRYENGKPVAATQIVVSTQHTDEKLTSDEIRQV
ncbi:MAG: methionine adenosyltransferase, partial [Clostridia bacterium]